MIHHREWVAPYGGVLNRYGLEVAATSLAIHAAINATDAVCGVRLGKRSGGQNHAEVLGLLGTAGADGKEPGGLLPLKTKGEYDHIDMWQTRVGL